MRMSVSLQRGIAAGRHFEVPHLEGQVGFGAGTAEQSMADHIKEGAAPILVAAHVDLGPPVVGGVDDS